jgi:hypothetical protein
LRSFAWFVAIILLAGVIGAALSYPAYELTSAFAAFKFHRVASRIAMLVLLAGLIWLCRRLGLVTKRDYGFGLPWRRFVGTVLIWSVLGMATAGVGAAFLLATQLRVADPAFSASFAAILRVALASVASGIAVALLEETVFRGALHTAIARESGSWAAVLLIAPLFAVLHFFAKQSIPPQEVGWGSGFHLLAHSFAPLGHPGRVLDAFLSWLTVGLILGFTRVLTGNIAVSIGLHAGWVVVLRLLQQCTISGPGFAASVWVSTFDGLLGYWLVVWGIAIAVGLWLSRALWVPPARVRAATARQGSASGSSNSSR